MQEPISRRAFLGALSAASIAPAIARAQTFPPDRVPLVSRDLWDWMRAQLVLDPDLLWLDTAGFGPTLRAVMASEYRSRERQSMDFRRYEAATFAPDSILAPLREVAAFFVADPADLVLTCGATEGLGIVAQGLDLQPGDEVLTTTHARPAALYPWLEQAKRRGIKVVQLPQPDVPATPESIVARFAAAITPRTRVLAFGHVQHTDGTVMPARELCALARQHGAFSVVDGALAAGHVDVRLTDLGCDAYATCFHKWLNGPHGTGALYLRRDVQPRVWPLLPEGPDGWDGAAPAATAQQKYGQLARYHGPSIDAVPIAFEFQQTVNRARIGSHIRELASYLRLQLGRLSGVRILTPTHPSLWSGILSLQVPGRDHASLVDAIAREDNIVVNRVSQGAAFDAIRVSMHAYNDVEDLDRFVVALQRRL